MIDIKLPELGENIAQGTISKVLVKTGDAVKKGQNVLEIETDKAVLEVPSPSEGTVAEVLVKAGDTVKVGQLVFKFNGGDAAAPAAPASAPQQAAPASQPAAAASAPQQAAPASQPVAAAQTAQPAAQPAAAQAAPAAATGAVVEMKIPELGENILQGTVTKVLVKVGDAITKGQAVAELETDKAVLEVPSSMDGAVEEILLKAGQVAKVGQIAFKIKGAAAATATASQPSAPAASPPAAAPAAPVAKTPAAAVSTPQQAASAPQPTAAPQAATGAVVEMKIPELGENILQGTVTKVLVKVGDAITKGQAVAELETDKAVLEVPSSMDGAVEEILLKAGQVAKVGQVAFKIKGSGAAATTAAPKPSAPAASAPATAAAPQAETTAAPVAASAPAFTQQPAKPAKDVSAAPSVRRFAREIGIDVTTVPGSGPGGRISIEDVKALAKKILTVVAQGQTPAGFAPKSVPLPDFSKWGTIERQPMNNVRKKTAEHLSNAWNSIPHVTQFDKADGTELEKLRKSMSTAERKFSVTPFLIKAIAVALKKFPQFNASVDMTTNEIVFKKYVNVGVAVDTDRGLLVPVLKNVDQKTIQQITDDLVGIAERARHRKTTLDEMSGGSFTLSNLGGIGGTFFTPIVNWPEVGILGVSRGVMEPIYKDGQFVPRLMIPLSLSYDHRVIDGADGARFIRFLCETIENPTVLT